MEFKSKVETFSDAGCALELGLFPLGCSKSGMW